MGHVILLGDSIFDNGRYVPAQPDVVRQLRAELPEGWKATLLAVDGDVTAGVARQLGEIPADSSHLVVSVGGNDALGASHLLGARASSVADAVALLADAQQSFANDYAEMLSAVLSCGLPVGVCTIYDTPPSGPDHRIIRTALSVFNDVITRATFAAGAALIDLRLICGEDGDYANPIEPSARGGAKIAAAIARFAAGEASAAVIA